MEDRYCDGHSGREHSLEFVFESVEGVRVGGKVICGGRNVWKEAAAGYVNLTVAYLAEVFQLSDFKAVVYGLGSVVCRVALLSPVWTIALTGLSMVLIIR